MFSKILCHIDLKKPQVDLHQCYSPLLILRAQSIDLHMNVITFPETCHDLKHIIGVDGFVISTAQHESS